MSNVKDKINNITKRFKKAYLALLDANPTHKIDLGQGFEIEIDLEKKLIILPEGFHIHSKGDLSLTADKHLLLESGKDEEERKGYVHGIWFNADVDEQGRPLKQKNEEE